MRSPYYNSGTSECRRTIMRQAGRTITAMGVILAGCATSRDIAPANVPPLTYQGWNCQQLAAEFERIDVELLLATNDFYDRKDHTRSLESFGTAELFVLAAPFHAYRYLRDRAHKESALSRWQGERDAVQREKHSKNCDEPSSSVPDAEKAVPSAAVEGGKNSSPADSLPDR